MGNTRDDTSSAVVNIGNQNRDSTSTTGNTKNDSESAVGGTGRDIESPGKYSVSSINTAWDPTSKRSYRYSLNLGRDFESRGSG